MVRLTASCILIAVALVHLTDCIFFFNDTATTEIYTLSLHDALPIWRWPVLGGTHSSSGSNRSLRCMAMARRRDCRDWFMSTETRSEEHTSELQSRVDLVCRLLLEKKKRKYVNLVPTDTAVYIEDLDE